ncbi:MAG: ATP-dependent Clp protease proteolytic subunit [Clostridia bacterium]|jgi:ATP-dependent Clp protease protease subunit|nr:ATP-dependent Clp protease proteolytic subunit [Clostridia bacterium]MBO7503944.1 ATP-dependent Clp protease proteolytic subunit [Clostridia bacterium]MBO7658181.1 ATP-dependent Clp protease proteolytic subunit [Clostridia bacterium]MBP5665533.1 ATP-dependent Clp protease proteolytic subunit [Clostridia bacterium]MBP5765936.1 ATP-dependent Clp protease proteolytic subunit [Clostridia bacterium]
MIINPTIFENDGLKERGYDPFSRILKDRVVLIFNDINDDLACTVIAQLLYLQALDPAKEITIYINSYGGSVSAGLAIYDTIKMLSCDVKTICVGMAASMGAVLLAAGTRGKRFALENSQVMIHQVLGGVEGQATDMEIEAAQILRIRERINGLLAKDTGTDIEIISHDTLRNKWLFADEAVRYGLVDFIIPNAR